MNQIFSLLASRVSVSSQLKQRQQLGNDAYAYENKERTCFTQMMG